MIRQPEHVPRGVVGAVCECGVPSSEHRSRAPRSGLRRPGQRYARTSPKNRGRKTTLADRPIVVIDGEGLTVKRKRKRKRSESKAHPHLYVYASACTEHGDQIAEIEDLKGLGTDEMLAWLTSLPVRIYPDQESPALSSFIFSGGYDLTKILENMPDLDLWKLARPEERAVPEPAYAKPVEQTGRRKRAERRKKPRQRKAPVLYTSADLITYALSYQRGCFIVQRVDSRKAKSPRHPGDPPREVLIGPRLVLWDCWSFFGTTLVGSLKSWSVGEKKMIDAIEALKGQRGDFKEEDIEEIKQYCRDECHLTAQMVRKLINAHIDAGLPLRSYYGAGSSGAAMLTKWKAKEWLGAAPAEMLEAIAQAYTGGRFEQALIGEVQGLPFVAPTSRTSLPLINSPSLNQPYAVPPARREGSDSSLFGKVYGYDVSSAYPYAQSQGMPCMAHGVWTRYCGRDLEERIQVARYALVKARVRQGPQDAWGPFAWRGANGDVTYPLTSPGTWVYRAEYTAARAAPHCWRVDALEAWIYSTECVCQPFVEVPKAYALRLEIGKEGPGLAIKLGVNSCLPIWTLVQMADGRQVPIFNLVAGDLIMGEGRLTRVNSMTLTGDKPILAFSLKNGQTLRCSPFHKLFLSSGQEIQAFEVKPGAVLLTRRGGGRVLSVTEEPSTACCDIETDTGRFYLPQSDAIVHNSYGKTCQSKGDAPPYQCWVWAGMTTGHCRAQILTAIAAAKDPWNIFQIATDGVFSREPLTLPAPNDTGTSRVVGPITEKCSCLSYRSPPGPAARREGIPRSGAPHAGGADLAVGSSREPREWDDPMCKRHVQKPLGGWEMKDYTRGLFCIRPGAYFPLDFEGHEAEETDKDREKVRARGVGRKNMSKHRQDLVQWWRERGDNMPYPPDYTFESVPVFVGFTAGIMGHAVKPGKRKPGDPIKVTRSRDYGRWIERDQRLSFFAQPKRSHIIPGNRLKPWPCPPDGELESAPYGPAIGKERVMSKEDLEMVAAEMVARDQPDGVVEGIGID